MPNQDGTLTDSEQLIYLHEKIDLVLARYALNDSERGRLDSFINNTYSCRCLKMAVTVSCDIHDYRVTYPNWVNG